MKSNPLAQEDGNLYSNCLEDGRKEAPDGLSMGVSNATEGNYQQKPKIFNGFLQIEAFPED